MFQLYCPLAECCNCLPVQADGILFSSLSRWMLRHFRVSIIHRTPTWTTRCLKLCIQDVWTCVCDFFSHKYAWRTLLLLLRICMHTAWPRGNLWELGAKPRLARNGDRSIWWSRERQNNYHVVTSAMYWSRRTVSLHDLFYQTSQRALLLLWKTAFDFKTFCCSCCCFVWFLYTFINTLPCFSSCSL